MLLVCAAWVAHASEPVRVSLLVADSATRQTVDVVQAARASHPELAGVDIRVYTSTRVQEQDLDHLRQSDLIIVQIMGRTTITAVKGEIAQAIAGGGRAFAFGASYNRDDAEIGIQDDPALRAYFDIGGRENIRNGLFYALNGLGIGLPYEAVQEVPEAGLYEPGGKTWYTDFESFRKNYRGYDAARPWIGMLIYKADVVAGTTAHVDAVIEALERRAFNVLPAFGYPNERPVEQFFFDEQGGSRVAAVVAESMKIGISPDNVLPLLERLDVPVINAIALYSQSRSEWEASPIGLDVMDRSWQIGMPEMAGLIQPTVFAAKELIKHPETGVEYIEDRPIEDRVEMLARRVDRWVTLREKPNRDKRVLLHYFNFPPGREAIGASYLNVVPESLWQVMKRLEQEGYDLSGMPDDKRALQEAVVHYGSNIANWNQDEVDSLARSGKAVLIPLETYKAWFAGLPLHSQEMINEKWGRPEVNTMMAYIDERGKRYFVVPVLQYGNILLSPQPSKGWTERPEAIYQDVSIPPSHHYVAFYFWLRTVFKADAMVQFGTHGTHEWLPGKEAGLSGDNPPEYLIEDLPNIYPYIVDDPGEGIQAKRRGMAVIVDHMTPPFDKAGLNPELRELQAGISDYMVAQQKSPLLAESRLAEISETAERMGLLKDLGIDVSDGPSSDLIDRLWHYLDEISDKATPFGLHTLGVAPEERFVQSTAEAVVFLETGLNEQERRQRIEEIKGLIRFSAKNELDAIVAGLSGRFVTAGEGGDPLRKPSSLPTGRNFYTFDPRRIPSHSTYSLGARLAEELIKAYMEKHGEFPDKLTFNLWGVETIRHEGVSESQIMHLMGVRPVWDARGIVRGVEAIPREELGRPRIDVTVVPSGLHRDLFSNVMVLLDQAASVAQAQDEPDNHARNNMLQTRAMLEGRGVAAELAARLAAVRVFSVPSGAYGTNINFAVDRSDTWEDESKVADVYFLRMSHMYGQGFWGDGGEEGMGRELLRTALSGSKIAIHSRSSNLYQTLDEDDFFQFLGGTAMAIRAVDGSTPEVYVSNLADPTQARQETLDKMMGREMRTRYLNPEWIKAMMKEGYAGAKFINEGVQHLWGWQVTVPEAVDAAKWNEMYQTYVDDRYELDMEEFFREAGNLWALQALITRMLEVVRKGYWEADEQIVRDLGERLSRLIEELEQECTAEHCHDPVMTKLVQANLVPVPSAVAATLAAAAMSAPASQPQGAPAPSPKAASGSPQVEQVQGYAMEEVTRVAAAEMEPITPWMQILGFLLLCAALSGGFRWAYLHRYRWNPQGDIR